MTTRTVTLVPNIGPNAPVCAGSVNIAQLTEETTVADDDMSLFEDVSESLNKKITFINLKANYFGFPVGSLFFSMVATNPNILLGYGTWTLLGIGRIELV